MKILIIGIGSIGERHLKNLLKLGYKNIVLSDFSNERLDKLKSEYHLPVYADWRLALKEFRPDATFICTSAETHVSLAKAAIQNGSHVFIEKPLSVNLSGIDGLIRLAKRKKKLVMVACNYLFHRGFRKLQKILIQKKYGRPLFCRVAISYHLPSARKNRNYRNLYAAKKNQGGGVILDSGSHAVNYLSALFGPIMKSSATASRSNFLGIQSEEAAVLALEHIGGILSIVSLDYLSKKPIHRLEAVTDRGLLILDFKNDSLVFEDDKNKKVIYQGNGDANRMFIDELKHFFHCLQKKKNPMQDLKEAKETLKFLV